MMEKAKLPALGYRRSVQEALGEKFHASPALLQKLNPGKTFAAGETDRRAERRRHDAPLADRPPRSSSTSPTRPCSLVDAAGKTYRAVPRRRWAASTIRCRSATGRSRACAAIRRSTTTPTLFWDADADACKATIPPGPNNPVGVVWIDLSKEHYGIHGTPEPSTIGKTAIARLHPPDQLGCAVRCRRRSRRARRPCCRSERGHRSAIDQG